MESPVLNSQSQTDGKGFFSRESALGPEPLSTYAKRLAEASTRNRSTISPLSDRAAAEAEAQKLATARRFYDQAAVPRRHTKRPEDIDQSVAGWVKVRDQIRDQHATGFLIALVGTRGPGKTQIGQQAIAHCCLAQKPARYVRAMDVFLQIREAYRKDASRSEHDLIESFRSPALLVIDEIQERGETAWEDRMLTNLIDKRYGDMGDTLLIANLTPDALRENIGPSIFDRLRETGGIVQCDWQSFRGKTNGR